MIKVYFAITPGKHGGGGTFLSYLTNYMKDDTDFEIVDNADEADIFFAMGAQTSLEEIPKLMELKKKGMKILYRVDGISTIRMPNGIERIEKMQDVADVIIYQSNYIKEEAEKLSKKHNNTKVIHNGVDINQFHVGLEKPLTDFLICEYSQNPCKRIQESLGLMKLMIEKNPKIKLAIVGKFSSDYVSQCFGLPQENVRYFGRLSHGPMPFLMRACKVLLFPNMKEACSNTALEAMASGMVVIHKKDGCMPELCGDTQVVWSPNTNCIDKALWKWNGEERLEGRRRVEKLFNIKNCIKQYLEILRTL